MRYLFMIFLVSMGFQSATPVLADQKVLAIGDSMFVWNRFSGRSIPDYVERGIGQKVVNKSVVGAMMASRNGKTGIPGQFRSGDWSVILINGGANDLTFKCNCSSTCGRVMNSLIDKSGTKGAIPRLLLTARKTGAKVVYVGYHRARKMKAPLAHCVEELDQLDARVAAFARKHKGISFANMQNVFPPTDLSYYAGDKTHPSPKGSKALGLAILKHLAR